MIHGIIRSQWRRQQPAKAGLRQHGVEIGLIALLAVDQQHPWLQAYTAVLASIRGALLSVAERKSLNFCFSLSAAFPK